MVSALIHLVFSVGELINKSSTLGACTSCENLPVRPSVGTCCKLLLRGPLADLFGCVGERDSARSTAKLLFSCGAPPWSIEKTLLWVDDKISKRK